MGNIFSNVWSRLFASNKECRITMWDVGGQKRTSETIKHYYIKMRNIVSKAAVIFVLLYSSDASKLSEPEANLVQTLSQQLSASTSKRHEIEYLMQSKFKSLEDKINTETSKVLELKGSLKTAKIDLETDKTMLQRHQEVLENEKKQMDLLDK